jgi:hypothetical protein
MAYGPVRAVGLKMQHNKYVKYNRAQGRVWSVCIKQGIYLCGYINEKLNITFH